MCIFYLEKSKNGSFGNACWATFSNFGESCLPLLLRFSTFHPQCYRLRRGIGLRPERISGLRRESYVAKLERKWDILLVVRGLLGLLFFGACSISLHFVMESVEILFIVK